MTYATIENKLKLNRRLMCQLPECTSGKDIIRLSISYIVVLAMFIGIFYTLSYFYGE